MFAIKCHEFPDYAFTNFKEYKKLSDAKKAAAAAIAEGWRMVEVLKRSKALAEVNTQLEWKLIQTIRRR